MYMTMYKLLQDLFFYNRSITGDGVRKTVDRISKEIPLKVSKIKSGSSAFDWTVPDEWNVASAKIYAPNGDLIVDFDENNLFLMSYSVPVDTILTLKQLKKHIVTDKTRPEWVPYSTSYYNENWAFCLPYNFVKGMKEGNYKVVIDSEKKQGELIYAESFVDNGAEKEVLISSYICHPSMANDSLSGVVLAVQLYKELKKINGLSYNYRFLFTPETIGTICFLNNNKKRIKSDLEYGLVATCVGDSGGFTYKKSRNEKSDINRIVENIFLKNSINGKIIEFTPLGSDERQYCSPGFDLDVGVLTRSMYGCFPEYHTSADNLDFVSEKNLKESLEVYMEIIKAYEANCKFIRKNAFCEPQMGKYNMYRATGGGGEDSLTILVQQRMWLLNYADGKTDLLTIAIKSGFDIMKLKNTLDELIEVGLIIKE
jgi:aminopeptidase-like protein